MIEIVWHQSLLDTAALTGVQCAGEAAFAFPDTMADLKAIPASLCLKAAFLKGYTTVGDGSGGVWVWYRTDTSTPDDVTIVNPDGNSGAGRWHKLI